MVLVRMSKTEILLKHITTALGIIITPHQSVIVEKHIFIATAGRGPHVVSNCRTATGRGSSW